MQKFQKSKYIICFLVSFILLDVLLCMFLSWQEMRITKITISQIPRLTEEDNVSYCIDENNIQNSNIVLRGWLILRGKNSSNIAIHVLLTDIDTHTSYKLPTAIVGRADVTEAMADGSDYGYSGFTVNLPVDNTIFPLEPERYKISFLYQIDDVDYVVHTNEFLNTEEI